MDELYKGDIESDFDDAGSSQVIPTLKSVTMPYVNCFYICMIVICYTQL